MRENEILEVNPKHTRQIYKKENENENISSEIKNYPV
jgi:hypothetical protein